MAFKIPLFQKIILAEIYQLMCSQIMEDWPEKVGENKDRFSDTY